MSSTFGLPIPAFPWSESPCTCSERDRCACGAKRDRNADLRDEATRSFLAHRLDVYRYLLHLGCQRAEADDVTQETFLRYYRALLDGRRIERDKTLPWVLTVAQRLAVDRFRRRRTEERLFTELSPLLAETLPDEGQSCEDERRERQRRANLVSAIQQLSTLERRCLHLRAAGHSLQTVGRIVGLPVNGVSRTVLRAVRRLRVQLDALA
jgi:RNA polymerase sigma factor (sigma-70 family)